MDVYFSPLACSLASRIAVYESGADAEFHRVDTSAGRTASGEDYREINPKGLVPALRTDDGEVLTENAAILQYIADRRPEAGLAPRRLRPLPAAAVAELHRLGAAQDGLHAAAGPSYPAEAKAKAKEEAAERFAYLNDHLTGRDWLLDDFSVADAYLAAVLNWNHGGEVRLHALSGDPGLPGAPRDPPGGGQGDGRGVRAVPAGVARRVRAAKNTNRHEKGGGSTPPPSDTFVFSVSFVVPACGASPACP